ncbi:MAG: PilX N-terminal domain-containing pilus assembly protein [Deltaproteobacteria bacterium]
MNARSQRGSALIISVLVVLVVAIIGVSVIRFASREVAGASSARRHQSIVACAEAGRQAILAQFKALGTAPTALQALNLPMDAANQVKGGHLGTTETSGIQVSQVVYLPQASFGPDRGVIQDVSNRVMATGGGGQPTKAVVRCVQPGLSGSPARELEVEFGLRFGI